METMRVELVEDKKKKVNWWQAVPTIITAFVAVIGIVVSCLTYLSQRATAIEDREAQRLADRNNRFTYAIEHLKDESLAIRMGALYELKKLGLEDKELQESIVCILGPFVRKGIETEDDSLLLPSMYADVFYGYLDWLPSTQCDEIRRPQEDIFLACEIASLFYEQSGCSIDLHRLDAENRDLCYINLKGANLWDANMQGANLNYTHLEGATLTYSDLKGAILDSAHIAAIARGTSLRDAFIRRLRTAPSSTEEGN